MNTIFVLLILFQLKHFLADYPLQGKYMLGKFKGGTDWVRPLTAHVAVHGAFTLAILLYYKPSMAYLAILDMVLHFIMDRVKASPDMLGKYKNFSANEYGFLQRGLFPQTVYECTLDCTVTPNTQTHSIRDVFAIVTDEQKAYRFQQNKYFWWALGLDQGVHHLTHYLIIYLMVS